MRIFIAVELPESVRERLGQLQGKLKGTENRIRWVDPSLIHLTMKFLGEVEEKNLEKVIQIARNAAGRFSVFKMKIGRMGVFPSFSSPRVIWVGIEEGKDKLETLAAELEEKLGQEGFSRSSRKWTSHLTLARVKVLKAREGLKALLLQYCKEVEGIEVKVESLSVIKSELTPQGAIYSILERIPLQNVNRN
ncbi:MAG TPA: RNA 2',3'-cyclic phosphodiesterase [Candidatus Aerophobetes bacterium]|uniref:RNA 2',3'-cyclic phosphodiesterase n=1 Tax=Aerophobetes bacterium TaxID=2030807 RepID=A0A7C1QX40_UNCAE|nr:RNA 2',3'-cyclic phosphodiesterase [Candidatus Aerophobetes bacterium]